jgi:hypothetical protein
MSVIITPRLLPGLQIGSEFVSVEPTDRTDSQGKPYWHWYVDLAGAEFQGPDLAGWGDAEGMLNSLVSFLSAAGEAYSYHGGMEEDSSTSLFPEPVCEWAAQNEMELQMAELEGAE